jgi:general secretion pathway protein F
MAFSLFVSTPLGEVRSIQLLDRTESDARESAKRGGYKVLSIAPCEEASAGKSKTAWLLGKRKKFFDPGLFSQELGALLEAGLSVIEALQTLGNREPEAVRQDIFEPIQRALQEGKTLSDAFGNVGDRFPPLLIASVKASEQTGDMTAALRRFSATYKRTQALREKVISASIYPALLTIVGLTVLVFLLGFVVPKFATIIESSSQELPFASRILMGWGAVVNRHFLEISVGATLCLLSLATLLSRPATRRWLAIQTTRIPFVGSYVRLYRQTQFWQTSAMLIDGGIPSPQAFGMSIDLLGAEDAEKLGRTLKEIQSGHELAQAFNAAGLVDSVSYRMLQVAQKTGQLGKSLQQLAGFQNDVLERGIDRFTKMLEPVLMIVIGLLIGGIVVLMYMPIFDLASSIQ